MILESILQSFTDMEARKWEQLYYYFDVHGTILVPDYDNSSLEFYPFAKEALQLIHMHPKIVTGLYTCSYPKEIARYIKFFKKNDIDFRYVNKNPEVKNTRLGCFTDKLYYNVLFEDKAAFRPTEWEAVHEFFEKELKDKYNIGKRDNQTDSITVDFFSSQMYFPTVRSSTVSINTLVTKDIPEDKTIILKGSKP